MIRAGVFEFLIYRYKHFRQEKRKDGTALTGVMKRSAD